MKLNEALSKMSVQRGITSVMSGIINNDFSVLKSPDAVGLEKEKIKSEVSKYSDMLQSCQSDWAYWSILGDLTYWKCSLKIFEAYEMCKFIELPDVEYKTGGLVVMDCLSIQEKYADKIMENAKALI